MKYIISLLAAAHLIALCSCAEENPCDDLKDGIYSYPELPVEHNMSEAEMLEYVDIPIDVLRCLRTDKLIESCLNYPYISLIMAGLDPQIGYERVKKSFRGLQELEKRPDRVASLIRMYESIDPLGYNKEADLVEIGRYVLRTDYLEIFIGQQSILDVLTNEEEIGLIEATLRKYNQKLPDFGGNQSLFDLECTTSILARIMYLKTFEDYVQIYESDINHRVLANSYGPSTIETVEEVIRLAENYLSTLQN